MSTRKLLISHVNWPEYYATSILSKELKDKIRVELDQHLEKISTNVTEEEHRWLANLYKEIKFYLNSTASEDETAKLLKVFKYNTTKFDTIRKEDIRTAVPELAEWYDTL